MAFFASAGALSIAVVAVTTASVIARVPVPVPSEAETRSHNELMTALWEMALSAERESLTLAELRDTLLPHLTSGKLRVKDVENQVEAVV